MGRSQPCTSRVRGSTLGESERPILAFLPLTIHCSLCCTLSALFRATLLRYTKMSSTAPLAAEALAANRSSSSSSRTSLFQPSLTLSGIRTTVKFRNKEVCTSAAAYHQSALLHTQLENTGTSSTVHLRLNNIDPEAPPFELGDTTRALWSALFPYFAKGRDAPETLQAEIVLPSEVLHQALLSLGATHQELQYTVSRSAIFQLFQYASAERTPLPFPYLPVTAPSSLVHPLRPSKPLPSTPLYSRIIPHLNSHFKLSVVGPNDVPLLHNWLNDDRVDEFWEERGTLEQHEKFVAERTADTHVIPVIGSYVETTAEGEMAREPEPATYSEIYWVKEDRLGPLMDVREYDRGIHMLVGSNAHRGPHRVRAWMPSLVHYCFLEDSRTERIVAEPNAKNAKIISYLESIGFKQHGTVEFPHKTAALMICDKADFYSLCPF